MRVAPHGLQHVRPLRLSDPLHGGQAGLRPGNGLSGDGHGARARRGQHRRGAGGGHSLRGPRRGVLPRAERDPGVLPASGDQRGDVRRGGLVPQRRHRDLEPVRRPADRGPEEGHLQALAGRVHLSRQGHRRVLGLSARGEPLRLRRQLPVVSGGRGGAQRGASARCAAGARNGRDGGTELRGALQGPRCEGGDVRGDGEGRGRVEAVRV